MSIPDFLLTDSEVGKLSAPQRQEYYALLARWQIEQARADPVMFARYLSSPLRFTYPITWFQAEWMRAVQQFKTVIIVAPRFHGKTKWLVTTYGSWIIGHDPMVRIINASMNEDMAILGTRDIESILRTNNYKSIFGDLIGKAAVWNQKEKIVARPLPARDPTLKAIGASTGAVGSRADIIFLDDVVGKENTISLTMQRELRTWAWSSIMPILEKEPDAIYKGQLVSVGTRWGAEDLHGDFIEAFRDDDTAFVRVYSAILPDGTFLWPEKAEAVQWYKNNMPTLDFNCQFLNDPMGDAGAILKDEWLHYADKDYIEEALTWPLFYGVDPAFAGKDKSDFTAIAKIRAKDNRGYLQDVILQKCEGPDIFTLITTEAEKDHPSLIYIESNAAQVMIAQHLARVSRLPIHKAYTTKDKGTRFRSMATHFELSRVLLNPDMRSGVPQFRRQWLEYDRGHDDALDAVDFALQAAHFTPIYERAPIYRPMVSNPLGNVKWL